MAEPTTQHPPEPPAQDFVYRPLSGVAVAGVVVSGVFAVLLVGLGAVALWRGEPFLLPLWLLLLPVAGVILSLLGRWHIQRSEGTRAGTALARWGLRIGLVAGLAYGVYYFATYLAVTNQSNSFLVEKGPDSGYLDRLHGDVYAAFLLTLPLNQRSGANPNDPEGMLALYDLPSDKEPRGLITLFLADPLVRRLSAPGAQAEIEPLGVKSWSYENLGYKVERFYRIKTREGYFEVLLTTQSMQGSEGERKWVVLWTPKQGLPPMTLNEEGKHLEALRRQTAKFANDWFAKLRQGQVDPRPSIEAFLDTQPAAARPELVKKASALLRAQQALTLSPGQPFAAATTVFPEVFSPALLPGFDDFFNGAGCFHPENLRGPDPQRTALARDALRSFVKRPPQGQFAVHIKPEDLLLAVVRDGGPGPVTVTHRIEFPIAYSLGAGKQQLMLVGGEVVVEVPGNAQQPPRIVQVNFLHAIPMQMQQGPPGG